MTGADSVKPLIRKKPIDAEGNKLFDSSQIAGQNNDIADCYALNISSSHETWLYYYTDFPLVQIRDFQLSKRWPRTPVSGSHAFSIADQHALFFGSYNDRRTLFEVDLSTLRIRKRFAVTDDGSRIKASGAFGRAHHLYLVTDNSLFLIDWKR